MVQMELDECRDAAQHICDALARQCRGLGQDAVLSHAHANKKLLHRYICGDSRQRADILGEVHPTAHALTVLCALYHARCGLSFLTAICVRGVRSGPSHAFIAAQSASAALDLHDSWPTVWPFDGRSRGMDNW